MLSRSAARPKCSSSATAMKYRAWRTSTIRSGRLSSCSGSKSDLHYIDAVGSTGSMTSESIASDRLRGARFRGRVRRPGRPRPGPGQAGFLPVWGHPKIVGFAVTVQLEPYVPGPSGAHIGATAVAGATEHRRDRCRQRRAHRRLLLGRPPQPGRHAEGRPRRRRGRCLPGRERSPRTRIPGLRQGADSRHRTRPAPAAVHRRARPVRRGHRHARVTWSSRTKPASSSSPRRNAEEVLEKATGHRGPGTGHRRRPPRPASPCTRPCATRAWPEPPRKTTDEHQHTNDVVARLAALPTASHLRCPGLPRRPRHPARACAPDLRFPGRRTGLYGAVRTGRNRTRQRGRLPRRRPARGHRAHRQQRAHRRHGLGRHHDRDRRRPRDRAAPSSTASAGTSSPPWNRTTRSSAAAGSCAPARTGYASWRWGRKLTINDVRISPNDIICGDSDGALAVPAAYAERVAEIAERIEDTEAKIIAAVKAGSTLVQARADLGYHDLQWRKA